MGIRTLLFKMSLWKGEQSLVPGLCRLPGRVGPCVHLEAWVAWDSLCDCLTEDAQPRQPCPCVCIPAADLAVALTQGKL